MSNIQIPNLPVAIALNGTEALEAVQSGTSVQTTVAGIAQYSYAYYPGFYISQLPAASSVNSTDIFPVVQGSIGPNTGTTYKATVAQLFTSPTFTGTTTLGGGAANYVTIAGGSSGNPVTFTSAGSDASPDIRFVLPSRGLVNIPRLSLGNNATGASTASPRVFTMAAAPGLSGTGGSAFRVGGNVFGTNLSASLTGYYVFAADTDNVTFANTSNGMTLNYRGQTVVAGWSGGRTTDVSFLNVSGAGTSGAAAYHVSGSSEARLSASAGGGPGAARGNLFSRNEIARVESNAGPHVISIFGEEFDVSVEGNARVLWKGGAKIVYLTGDASRGLQEDFAYSIGMQATSTSPGAGIAYAIGGVEGWWPLTETSVVMEGIVESGIIGGPAAAIGAGVDFSNLKRIRESAFKSINYKVDGSGNLGALVASGERVQTRGEIVAKTAVVSSIEVVDGGLYGGTITVALSASPGGGTNATASVAALAITTGNSIGAVGSGYVVGDTFTVSGGTATAGAAFTATIADNVMNVSAVSSGTITNNSIIVGAISGTRIIAFGTGSGGAGTYIVDTSQNQAVSTAYTSAGAATGVVTSVSGGGVTGFRIINPGRYTVAPASPVATTTSGAGTGFTFTPLYTILALTITNAGTLYSEFLPPTVVASGSVGTLRGATFKVGMTGTQVALALNPGGAVQITASALGNYANDAAAAAGGVPVNGIYRNGSFLMVRVA